MLLRRINGPGRGRLQRKKHLQPGFFFHPQDRVSDFVHRVLLDLLAALQTEGAPHAREQQPQIIIDLGRSGNRGARITRGVLLPDCHCGSDPVDEVGIRLLDAFQKLASVGGQRLDIPPLAFRIDGVEGKRGFARTGHTRHHGEGVMPNRKVDILQVVNASAANNNTVCGHLQKGPAQALLTTA